MKIGMEQDPVEEIDREAERVMAAAADAYFSGGQTAGMIEEANRLSLEWVDATTPQFQQQQQG